jgi:hypothetical protein
MNFTESKLERAFCELLAQEGSPHSAVENILLYQSNEILIK